MYERMLAIKDKGSDAEDVLSAVDNLLATYESQNKVADAIALCKKVLAARTRALGAEHPSVISCMLRLAAFYCADQKWPQAQPLLDQCVEILSRQGQSLELADTLDEYSIVMRQLDKKADADRLKAQADTIRQKHQQKVR